MATAQSGLVLSIAGQQRLQHPGQRDDQITCLGSLQSGAQVEKAAALAQASQAFEIHIGSACNNRNGGHGREGSVLQRTRHASC